ncbi:hypothetical protein TNCV_169671 [Trichonephila clavipes]|nr:hypothetical protein TNCV_169671 [Trichonephila clavipes]
MFLEIIGEIYNITIYDVSEFFEKALEGRLNEEMLTSNYSATRGFLATGHVILINGQVTKTTPELALPSSNFHTTPTGRRLSPKLLNVHRPRLHGGSSVVPGSNSWHSSHESVILTTRQPRPPGRVYSTILATSVKFWNLLYSCLQGLPAGFITNTVGDRLTNTFKKDFLCLNNEHIFEGDQGDTPEIMDEILTTARDLELQVNEDDIEKLIMGHEDELTTEELQEILNEEHQETQRNVSPEQEEDERGPMSTSAIKNLLKQWADVRAMVLEWHPNQTDVSRVGDLYNNNAIYYF